MECRASVFFLGTGQLIHDVVESARCVAYIRWRRADRRGVQVGTPVMTTVSVRGPRCSATSALTVPTTLPKGCSGGSSSLVDADDLQQRAS
jgi:hypothetical protein